MQDFEGQRLAEMITTALLGTVGVCYVYLFDYPEYLHSQVIAFFLGFVSQDIKLTLYIGLAGTALTFLAVVPPWPFYNKYPEQWLPPYNSTTSGVSIDVDGQKVG